jgi:hypothetical protein
MILLVRLAKCLKFGAPDRIPVTSAFGESKSPSVKPSATVFAYGQFLGQFLGRNFCGIN